ncbi:MAG: acyl-CoA/acyl-ACP dehydrogenase [Deltaproteobacteria bacterium]|nr:acyl-CoA/acyl-ACP dehydrogenase [Deltaproteobacteria bacterium]
MRRRTLLIIVPFWAMSWSPIAAVAKGFAAENAYWIAKEALQVMGGIGYTTKHDMERHFRDIRSGMVAVGTNGIMRLVVQREHYKEFSAAQEAVA